MFSTFDPFPEGVVISSSAMLGNHLVIQPPSPTLDAECQEGAMDPFFKVFDMTQPGTEPALRVDTLPLGYSAG